MQGSRNDSEFRGLSKGDQRGILEEAFRLWKPVCMHACMYVCMYVGYVCWSVGLLQHELVASVTEAEGNLNRDDLLIKELVSVKIVLVSVRDVAGCKPSGGF